MSKMLQTGVSRWLYWLFQRDIGFYAQAGVDMCSVLHIHTTIWTAAFEQRHQKETIENTQNTTTTCD